jgi:hypothetical protein
MPTSDRYGILKVPDACIINPNVIKPSSTCHNKKLKKKKRPEQGHAIPGKDETMRPPIKILHIDADYRIIYRLFFDGVQIKSLLPLETALSMLRNDKFDFIFSEPQKIAVFTPRTASDTLESLIPSLLKDSLNFSPPTAIN